MNKDQQRMKHGPTTSTQSYKQRALREIKMCKEFQLLVLYLVFGTTSQIERQHFYVRVLFLSQWDLPVSVKRKKQHSQAYTHVHKMLSDQVYQQVWVIMYYKFIFLLISSKLEIDCWLMIHHIYTSQHSAVVRTRGTLYQSMK